SLEIEQSELEERVGFGSATSTVDASLELSLAPGPYRALIETNSSESVRAALALRLTPYSPPENKPDPGSDKEDALALASVSELREVGGYVGVTDQDDYFRFELPANATLSYALTNSTGSITAQLFHDAPIIDATKPMLSDYAYAGSDAFDSVNLERGTYYWRISSTTSASRPDALYRLQLSAAPYPAPESELEPGNDPATALLLRGLEDAGPLTIGGYVGSTDPEDFYRLELARNGVLKYALKDVINNGSVVGKLFVDAPLPDFDAPLSTVSAYSVDGDDCVELGRGAYLLHVTPYDLVRPSLYTLLISVEESCGVP
ncbi:MAG TPA: pre-peptidase C-terminal domain-containing protein, partial [Polyangiaceae bacterium]|nr:pre-peptidase C-terminal domain-containing protein [Polyangiaceae bacterium]